MPKKSRKPSGSVETGTVAQTERQREENTLVENVEEHIADDVLTTVVETANVEKDSKDAINGADESENFSPSDETRPAAASYSELPDTSNRAIALAWLTMAILIVILYFMLNFGKKDVASTTSPLIGTEATVQGTGSENANSGASIPADPNRAAKEGDTVAVDYVGKLEDGTVFDTSIKSVAEKTSEYNPGRDYSPLLFTVGAGQMIKGFDKGVMGMKVGEKRTLRIPPEEAYGTGGSRETVDSEAFKDKFVVKDIDRKRFSDTMDVPVTASTFTDQGKEVPKLGEVVTAGGTSATVSKVDGDNLTLTVENRNNPFFGKTLKVGLEGESEGNKLKIVKLTETTVDVEIENRNNPFFGKTLKVGLETEFNGQRYTVVSINKPKNKDEKETVTLEVAHKLSGKTLVFEVELKEIK